MSKIKCFQEADMYTSLNRVIIMTEKTCNT